MSRLWTLLHLLLRSALNLLLFLHAHLTNLSNGQRLAAIGLNGLLLLHKRHGRRRWRGLRDDCSVNYLYRRFHGRRRRRPEDRFSSRSYRRSYDSDGRADYFSLIDWNDIFGNRLR